MSAPQKLSELFNDGLPPKLVLRIYVRGNCVPIWIPGEDIDKIQNLLDEAQAQNRWLRINFATIRCDMIDGWSFEIPPKVSETAAREAVVGYMEKAQKAADSGESWREGGS